MRREDGTPAKHDPLIDRRGDTGPFDIIGDVHGCGDELIELLARLGTEVRFDGAGDARRAHVTTPPGRRVIFVGDLVDRGPRSPDVLRIVMDMVAGGQALCVPGNHDARFLRWLQGRNIKPTHGIDATMAQMTDEAPPFHERARLFIEHLPLHLWLDRGALVVVHAGIEEPMLGSSEGRARQYCLYGDTNGTDADGLPIRYHWAAAYSGAPSIIYGHTPIESAAWVNNTLCIDTGCCFGGGLTALRWPEREILVVPARATYAERRRPFGHPPPRPVS